LEKNLWSLESDDTTRMIMTSERFVDLEKGVYSNTSSSIHEAQLNSYTHQRNREEEGHWKLALFSSPVSADLPVVSSDMQVGELIIYDRALSEKERIQVESYLALKYGLALQHPIRTVYLDSDGEAIWSDEDAGQYIHRIAAVGRDLGACFDNRQSANVAADNPISIAFTRHAERNALNTHAPGNREYLIWSDNGASLELSQSYADLQSLERVWKINDLTYTGRPTEILLDTRKLAIAEHDGHWWLQIKRDGLPELIRGSEMDKGIVRFDSISWDTDGSGSDRFTFLPGGDMMPALKITAPECGAENGEIRMRCHGGEAPYTYAVREGNRLVFEDRTSSEVLIDNLSGGVYQVFITDHTGTEWRDNVILTSSAPDKYCVPESISMPAKGSLRLTRADLCASPASRVSLVDHAGTNPDGEISISKSGEYFIEIEEDECVTVRRLQVNAKATSVFEQVSVFPNPLKAGQEVTYRIILKARHEVTLSLYDASGRIVIDRKVGDSQVINGNLGTPIVPGSYTLRFTADGDISSTQIITID